MPTSVDETSFIEIFADGSFCRELGLGAWAFSVPRLGLLRTGSSVGSTSTRFELLAVLNGLEEVIAADRSDQALRVYCDCEATVRLVSRVRDGQPLKTSASYEDRADLLQRLGEAVGKRPVDVTRCSGKDRDHRACHRSAHQRLKEELTRDPTARYRVALVRQHTLRDRLVEQRETLLKKLARIDVELAIAESQGEALEAFLANPRRSIEDSARD